MALHCNPILIKLACRCKSTRLRAHVESAIADCAKIMWRSWTESNNSLQGRVSETTEAHAQLQERLARTNREISDQEKYIEQINKAIIDKDAPLKVYYENIK